MQSREPGIQELEHELEKAQALCLDKKEALTDKDVIAAREELKKAQAELELMTSESVTMPTKNGPETIDHLLDHQQAWLTAIRASVPDSMQSSIDEVEAALLGTTPQPHSTPDVDALPIANSAEGYDWTSLIETTQRFEADIRSIALAECPAQLLEAQVRVESANSHYMSILALRQADYHAALAACEKLEQTLATARKPRGQDPYHKNGQGK